MVRVKSLLTSLKRRTSLIYGKLRPPKPKRSTLLLGVQLAGVVVALLGVSAYSIPVALIIGGVLLVAAVERQP